jgi:putative membrane-bound dehydrogenase-like protein
MLRLSSSLPALLLLLLTGVAFAEDQPPHRSSDPLSPQQSIAAMHLKEGFEIECVAAEPLVTSPVAIDWGPDGRLWVVEMDDYPYGIDGHGKPGGRVRVLESTHGDGHYDKSTIFLDGINMPNGIAVWRNGVIVTAAPEIFYAEDTTGSGHADVKKTLFTGFKAGNPQLRVNGLRWGLDGWLYCANGWSGGQPQSLKTGQKLKLDGRDIRLQPDDGSMDLQSGQSEFGRDRDDWNNWFGCDNSHPLFHFALDDRYLRRNANVPGPDPRVQVIVPANPQVFPVSKLQTRYYTDAVGHFTSACSATIYRDELLFPRGADEHMFVCEPAYNIVHHEVVTESGISFSAQRPPDEQQREFLASEDQWFRPVMVRTGPDGAIWVVDMYRYMIEHPDWLPSRGKEELKHFYRDGEDRGRIYRIYPKGIRPRPIARLNQLSVEQLVTALDSPNGPQRDSAQKLLLWRNDPSAVRPLQRLASESRDPKTRLQSLSALDAMNALPIETIRLALHDDHPAIRREALKWAEPRAKDDPALIDDAVKLTEDPDAKVRLQLACTLGEWDGPKAADALARIASSGATDPYLVAAVMSSAPRHFDALVSAITRSTRPLDEPLYGSLIALAVAAHREAIGALLAPALTAREGNYSAEQFAAIERYLNELAARHASPGGAEADQLSDTFAAARRVAADPSQPADLRAAAVGLLGRAPDHVTTDMRLLASLLGLKTPPQLQSAAVRAMGRIDDPAVPQGLLAGWSSHPPQLRVEILDRLLARESWALKLLEAIRAGAVARHDIDPARRQRLLEHGSTDVRSLAEQVLGSQADPSRQQVVDRYQPALKLVGDAERGAKLFAQNCAVCHRKGETGNDIGPNLDSVMGWQSDALLVAILDPSRQVEPQYVAYTATLQDGDAVYGVITSETAGAITMKGLDGKPRTLLRTQIASLAGAGRSLMPDGLEAALDPQAIANVIRFLQSPPK